MTTSLYPYLTDVGENHSNYFNNQEDDDSHYRPYKRERRGSKFPDRESQQNLIMSQSSSDNQQSRGDNNSSV